MNTETTGDPGPMPPREYKSIVSDGQFTQLVQTDTTFLSLYRGYPSSTVTTLLDKAVKSKVEWNYETYVDPGGFTVPDGNVTQKREWDFIPTASSFSATPLRKTVRTYVTTNPVNGTDYRQDSIFIFSLVSSEQIQDGGGVQQARTDYVYDDYSATANHAALVPRSGITGHDDTNYGTAYTPRGNVTDVKRYTDAASFVTAYSQYDVAGNVVKTIDPRGFASTIGYTDNFSDGLNRNTFAYPTTVTNPKGQSVSTKYYFNTGLASEVADLNGTTTTFAYNDPLSHLTQTVRAANRGEPLINQTTISYNYAGRTVASTSDLSSYNDNQLKSEQVFDGLGRPIESRAYETPTTYVKSVKEYDAAGRVSKVYNATRNLSEDSYGWTVTSYDGLNRVKRVETFDRFGSTTGAVTSSYFGNEVTMADQQSKQRKSVADALGRASTVYEPDGFGSLNVTTSYSYDLLNNLTQVTQGAQTRRFRYDQLSRLLDSASVEEAQTILDAGQNWSAKFTYDANSNVLTKQDARLITTTLAYDELNRVTSKTYSDTTPTVTLFYDANQPASVPVGYNRGSSIGKLTATTTSTTGTYYGYDSAGRINQSYQRLDGTDYGFTNYSYNKASLLTSETFPSGRVVTNSFDSAGRPSTVASGGTNYASSVTYAATGGLAQETLGNGLIQKIEYNSRLQTTAIRLGTGADPNSVLSLVNDYGLWNGSSVVTSQNNGNLGKATITPGTGQTPFVQTFTYDQLNRLATATENKSGLQQWKQGFTFDRWGNRSVDAGNTTANVTPPALTYNTATNRITGPGVYGFDNVGNMTQDPLSGTTTYTLNGDNRVTTAVRNSVTVGTYTYDGEGRRVKRVTSTTTTRYIFDAGGKLIAEYTGSTPTLDREYVSSAVIIPASQPAPGGDANNRTQYITTDHLGSPRVITNAVGAVYSRRDFLPFGELIDPSIGSRSTVTGYSNGSTDGEKHKFTGKERDTETGNDFFEARYYRDILGRFTSPDPLNGTAPRPQSWNRYAYVLGNPLKLVDPTGMEESLAGSNRRNVNSFNQDTLGLGNDDFAVVAGYVGGEQYGTLTSLTADFAAESGVQTPSQDPTKPIIRETVEVTEKATGGFFSKLFRSLGKASGAAVRGVGRFAGSVARSVFKYGDIILELAFPSTTVHAPSFSDAVIDAVVESSRRLTKGGQITEGARAIDKKLGHARSSGFTSAFDGILPTQENAEKLIRDILGNSVDTRSRGKNEDVFNASGQGVRFEPATNVFVTFLEKLLDK